jgi:fructokinase
VKDKLAEELLAKVLGWQPKDVAEQRPVLQAMAAWNCRYDGARGGMYVSTKAEFDLVVGAILKGNEEPPKPHATPKLRRHTDPVWCDCCVTSA